MHKPAVRERFWRKVDKDGPVPTYRPELGQCWIWTAGKMPRGYGVFHPTHGKTTYAHRYAYEDLIGPIPDGLHIDHLCRVTPCVNPAHLEAVTQQVNNARTCKDECDNGHAFTEANTYEWQGHRFCIACRRARSSGRDPRSEPTTQVNTGRRSERTHCPRGHAYSDANTYRSPGGSGRQCRTCKRDRRRQVNRDGIGTSTE